MRKRLILLLSVLLLVVVTACAKRPMVDDMPVQEVTTGSTETNTEAVSDEPTETMPEAFGNDEDDVIPTTAEETSQTVEAFSLNDIPEYSGTDVIVINNDEPFFTEEEREYNGTYINLSELDGLGRCQVAMACVGQEILPTEERGDISSIHPSGWIQRQLSNGKWLYNRSHLLMYALTGLNDDERNLITGTEQFNQETMLGYETMITSVIEQFNAHVIYRVTPYFVGDELVARGVLMEAYCIEYPEECTFNVFAYNVENNVTLDYTSGESEETPGITQGIAK